MSDERTYLRDGQPVTFPSWEASLRDLHGRHIGMARDGSVQVYPASPNVPDPTLTHYAGCWRTAGHHMCAVLEIERLTIVSVPEDA